MNSKSEEEEEEDVGLVWDVLGGGSSRVCGGCESCLTGEEARLDNGEVLINLRK